MESFNSFVVKQVSGTFKEVLFQKEHLTEIFAWGKSHFPSYGSGGKSTSCVFFQEAVQDFLTIGYRESENFGIMPVEYWDFLHPVIATS